jgi:hypothetical protein
VGSCDWYDSQTPSTSLWTRRKKQKNQYLIDYAYTHVIHFTHSSWCRREIPGALGPAWRSRLGINNVFLYWGRSMQVRSGADHREERVLRSLAPNHGHVLATSWIHIHFREMLVYPMKCCWNSIRLPYDDWWSKWVTVLWGPFSVCILSRSDCFL